MSALAAIVEGEYRRQQARLRQLEALESAAVRSIFENGSTAYFSVLKRRHVMRRRVRRLELLLVRAYRRMRTPRGWGKVGA